MSVSAINMTRRSQEGEVLEFARVAPAELADAIALLGDGETLEFCEVCVASKWPVAALGGAATGPRSGLWIGGGR